ncbi:MAG: hypothetical protein EOL90_11720, partial [Spartobacteria bacterium]|nr:hypothetical protein [Spartobacteria bacterium]
WQHADFPLTAADVCTAYAPWTFDASVYEIFPALTAGAALHVLPEDLRLDASGLRDYFRRNRVSVSFLPPQVGHQVLDGHDFPDLRVVTLAGDKPGRLAPRPFTVRNCYGPTEFTVCATSWPVTEHRAAPPIGAPIANARCSILGRHGQLQPFGAAGELCLSGVQVARGYLNRPEQTGAAFVANPFVSDGPHARVYRTGDLCRLMPDGNLEFLGRIDGQVKLRGQRLEPGEIESALLAHPLVTAAVAVLHAEGQAALLAAYATVLPGVRESELSAWLAARLPRWMLPQAIVLLDAMPLTANGKIDRDALPRPLVAARGDSAPRGPEEKALAAAWRDILGVDSPGLEDNFLALGGDSIKAMLVVARMRAMGYGLTSRDVLHGATLAATASQLRLAPVAEGAAMVSPGRRPAGRDATALAARFGQGMEAVYGLTPMQEGLLYHHTLEPGSPAYVEQSRLDLRGPLDADELARRVTQAGRRHGSLRTVFAWKGLSQPWQIVLGEAALVLERTDLTALPAPEQDERMRALLARVRADGLDLERGPLLRLTLCALGPDHHALLVSFHHIILDGWSLGVLAGELFGATVPAPAPPFARYVDWLQGRDQAAHLAFWATYLEGARSASLPGRKAASTRDDRDLPLQVGPDLSERLSALAIQSGVTVNTVLQAAWAVALGRTVNEDDVIFGAVYSGRDIDLPDAAATVGLFVNTVPVRVRVNPERTVRQLLAEVRDGSRALEAHVHVPLTDIRRQAGAGGALVEHLFVFENLPPLETGGALAVETAGGFNQTTYDLALVLDHGRELRGRIQYNAAALDPWLVEGLGRHFVTVLRQFADNADMRTATVRLIEPRANVVAQRVPAPRTTVVDLFRRSATRHAARTALVDGAARWTYAELDARSEALAHRLRELGAGPESVVAMLLPRSAACVLGLLAILKAGAAYLVLDPGYPDERLAALLADAAPRALIATADHAARVPGFDGPVIDIAAPLDAAPGVPPSPGPRDLAYLVHTSGTTGRPKGVMIEHRSLANFCAWHVEHYRLTPEDRAAHVFSFAFDASAWGIFPLLASGGAIHVLDDATRTDPRLMHAYFEDHAITLAN